MGSWANIYHSLCSQIPVCVLWCFTHQLLPKPSNHIRNPELDLIEQKASWQLPRFTKDFIQPLVSDFTCKFREYIAQLPSGVGRYLVPSRKV